MLCLKFILTDIVCPFCLVFCQISIDFGNYDPAGEEASKIFHNDVIDQKVVSFTRILNEVIESESDYRGLREKCNSGSELKNVSKSLAAKSVSTLHTLSRTEDLNEKDISGQVRAVAQTVPTVIPEDPAVIERIPLVPVPGTRDGAEVQLHYSSQFGELPRTSLLPAYISKTTTNKVNSL